MSEFSLSELVRDVFESAEDVTSAVVAEAVLDKIADDDLRAALRECLPVYVTNRATAWRANALAAVNTPDGEQRPDGASQGAAGKGGATVSARWVSAVNAWLASAVDVAGQRKRVTDCTAEECETVASDRRGQAAALVRVAEQFEALAVEMRQRRARTVGRLPLTVVLGVLRGEGE